MLAIYKQDLRGAFHGMSGWVVSAFVAVSYTHLDVSKRQVYGKADSQPAGPDGPAASAAFSEIG